MKRYWILILAGSVILNLTACDKKEESMADKLIAILMVPAPKAATTEEEESTLSGDSNSDMVGAVCTNGTGTGTGSSCGDAILLPDADFKTQTGENVDLDLEAGKYYRVRVTNQSTDPFILWIMVSSFGLGDDLDIATHGIDTAGPDQFCDYEHWSNSNAINGGASDMVPPTTNVTKLAVGQYRDVCILAVRCVDNCTGTLVIF